MSDPATTSKEKMDLYLAARDLFDRYYSHPQVLEKLAVSGKDPGLLNEIADKAMKESWDKLYRKAIRLFGEGKDRETVIRQLSGEEPDMGIVEILVDDLYNRWFEISEAYTQRATRIRRIVRWIRNTAIATMLIFLLIGKENTFVILGITFALYFLVAVFFSLFIPVRGMRSFKRFAEFQKYKYVLTMSRIETLISRKKSRLLNVYCTAGFPELDSTLPVLRALQEGGADLVEIGMPYSDPLADGPVIQASGARALANGMTIQVLFDQLRDFRKEITLPVILMGYMNPVLQYGFEKFCADAAAIGIDGLILPDLPEQAFETIYGKIIKNHGLDFIFLITPETSEQRIRVLDQLSSGFLYAVSSSSTTGKDKDFKPVEVYLQRLKKMGLKNSVLVGFGIKDQASFDTACKHANGAIIGSAYIQALENGKNIFLDTKNFLQSILIHQ